MLILVMHPKLTHFLTPVHFFLSCRVPGLSSWPTWPSHTRCLSSGSGCYPRRSYHGCYFEWEK